MVRDLPRISRVSVVAMLPRRLMPSSRSPLVMPVAEDHVVVARHLVHAQHLTGLDTHFPAARQLLFADAAVLGAVAFHLMARQQTRLHVAVQRADHRG